MGGGTVACDGRSHHAATVRVEGAGMTEEHEKRVNEIRAMYEDLPRIGHVLVRTDDIRFLLDMVNVLNTCAHKAAYLLETLAADHFAGQSAFEDWTTRQIDAVVHGGG